MTLGSDIAPVLLALRAEFETRCTETVTFSRDGFTDDENGVPAAGEETVHADIPCRVKFTSQVTTDAAHAGMFVTVQQRRVDVPVGASPDVREGDYVTVTASTADTGLVGVKFRIEGMPDRGQVTAWRYPVSEVTHG